MPEYVLTLKLDDKDLNVKIHSSQEDVETLRKKFSETGNETGKTITELRTKLKNLTDVFDHTEIGTPEFKKLKAEIDKTKTALDQAAGSVEKVEQKTRTLPQAFGEAGRLVAGVMSVAVAFDYLKGSIDKAGEMEGYKTSLKVMLGGTEQAQKRLEELIDFAANTPYEIPQVVGLGNQLQAVGRYSKQTMTDLGDLASAANKPLEQVAGAYSKLASGQKGIAVDMFRDLLITTNDWVEATGKGVSKTGELKATTEEMLAALPKILEKKHFSGMMEAQSKTMKGQLSNLSDAAGQLQTEFGNALMPFVKGVTGMAIPALTGLKGNVDLIISVVKIGTISFVAYEVAVNGVAVAQKVAAVSTELFKKAQDALKASMAGNPIGLIVVAITAAAVALYELNEAYGNTIENQKKWNGEAQKLNESEQKRISTQIEAKKKTGDVATEYERLYKVYQKTKEGTDEHKKAEDRLHTILTEQQKIYPGLITNTFDYAGNVDKMKTAAAQSVGDITKLTGELTKQQKALLDLKLVADDIALDEASEKLRKATGMFGTTADAGTFARINEEMRSGKKPLSEIRIEVEELMSKYSAWAAMGGDDKQYNIDKANALNELLKAINSKVDDYNLKTQGKGIDATGTEDPNKKTTSTTTTDTDTSFADKKKKALEDLKKDEFEKQQIAANAAMDYLALAEKKEAKEAELAELHKRIINAKSDKDLEKYQNEKDLAEKSIKLIDDQMKKEEDNLAREMDIFRKQQDDKIKASNDAYKASEAAIKAELELHKMKADVINDEYAKEYQLLEVWKGQELEHYKNVESAKEVIDEIYADKKSEIDKKVSQKQIEAVSETLGSVAKLLGKHTAAYKILAGAQALIDTYKSAQAAYTAMVGIPVVGPGLAIVAAAAAVTSGLLNVAQIAKVDTNVKGFETGGVLPAGKKGIFEGYGNEIVAPEKDFISVVNELLIKNKIAAIPKGGINEAVMAVDRKRDSINFGMSSSSNNELLQELRNLNSNMEIYSKRPAKAVFDNDEASKVGEFYNYEVRRSR